MSAVEYQRGDYVISTDKSKLDTGSIRMESVVAHPELESCPG